MATAAMDVFVSYKREDRQRVAPLVEGLRASGLSVWWDADIPGGATWREEILRHFEVSKCVIVVWSKGSVSPAGEFVHDEAQRAKQRGILLPVIIDAVTPPLGFGQTQALPLIEWRGDRQDPRFLDVERAAKAVVANRPRPQPSVPIGRRRIAGTLAIVGLVFSIAFALDVANVQSGTCAVPGIRTVCGRLGLGNVPSPAEQDEWMARPVGNCEWLRTFLVRHPNGGHAGEADRLLQAKRSVGEESWVPEERRVPLFVRSSIRSLPSEEAARADALARGATDAQRACVGYGDQLFRLRSATVAGDGLDWRCEQRVDGVRCSFESQAICAVEARHTVQREVCQ